MSDLDATAASLMQAVDRTYVCDYPYRHWLPEGLLPSDTLAAIDALPLTAPEISDTLGRRETNNKSRLFFGVTERKRYPVCDSLANALQNDYVVKRLERLCGIDLRASYLRIEYCLDTEGFWLEPHTDIGAKLFTMLIYLSDGPGSESWGTDILDSDLKLVTTSPYRRNLGLIFVPAANTWHGFRRKRPIRRRAALADRQLRQARVAQPSRVGLSRSSLRAREGHRRSRVRDIRHKTAPMWSTDSRNGRS